jgi:dipeptidyl aminopeptidase/acylaminoacyl peptidase
VAPYGSWESPLSPAKLASVGQVYYVYTALDLAADGVYWLEGRARERGRSVLVYAPHGGEPEDTVPADFNVRTRVHEYGGGAFWRDGETLFCSSFADGRVYRLERRGAEPRPVTPEPPEPHGLRYADGRVTPDGLVVCVRERHEGRNVHNELVAFPADGSEEPTVIAAGNDFYAAPRPSPDGTRLAWLTWNHPLMPFEGCELCVGSLGGGEGELVAGGPTESIFQPEWGTDGALYFSSDRTGWWNLYRNGEPLAPVEAEIGRPHWLFDESAYDFLADGRIACTLIRGGIGRLGLIDPTSGRIDEPDLPYTAWLSFLRAQGSRAAGIASSPTEAPAIVVFDTATGDVEVVRRSVGELLDEDSISRPEPIEFPSAEGRTAHAFFYAPCNSRFEAPDDELPPLRVLAHGGPTSSQPGAFIPEQQFWTSRGYAVLDVNYGGSTGYGRDYRELLRGRWGEVDVQDCIAAARHVAERGLVDPARMSIAGASAGGYTTLCALAFHDVFAAGYSIFGVTDLERFHEITHKFEAHYDESLIGPYPEAADLYRARSPIHAADRISVPLLIAQGLEDKVVPPSQAEELIAALDANGVAYAYLAFEGEGHGFRREDSLRRAIEGALSFFATVFGHELADEVEPLELANAEALRA